MLSADMGCTKGGDCTLHSGENAKQGVIIPHQHPNSQHFDQNTLNCKYWGKQWCHLLGVMTPSPISCHQNTQGRDGADPVSTSGEFGNWCYSVGLGREVVNLSQISPYIFPAIYHWSPWDRVLWPRTVAITCAGISHCSPWCFQHKTPHAEACPPSGVPKHGKFPYILLRTRMAKMIYIPDTMATLLRWLLNMSCVSSWGLKSTSDIQLSLQHPRPPWPKAHVGIRGTMDVPLL